MIAISPRPVRRQWNTISFASTLYLCPILDLLLTHIPSHVPSDWQEQVRLGLQEALVNAAKHGNNLDPGKQVHVRFSVSEGHHWWVISDQGCESTDQNRHECSCIPIDSANLPEHEAECGRGLFILHQIFDQVQWSPEDRELRLCKSWR
ncbi:ATP-binding protein [Roseofilum sp. BLCC_M91]|uniref:ATP-binding protein n=1 Tax=Roseofilum halophilum BLCC-M91 TaxID=3022259 RepID=A0ABT7BIE3_9CYAN|nr:ATP-binding protein [Roseofilum halophilum]MDJ1178963.1 ATP-binding protein [Roseofilum halophilum BLCC-M91]